MVPIRLTIYIQDYWFRIVHLARDGHSGDPVAPFREQMVEIALGPIVAFGNGNIGALVVRAPPSGVVKRPRPANRSYDPRPHASSKSSGKLSNGGIRSTPARFETGLRSLSGRGITRARVTQVLGLLRLAPEIREKIFSVAGILRNRSVTERMLRPIGAIVNKHEQIREFHKYWP